MKDLLQSLKNLAGSHYPTLKKQVTDHVANMRKALKDYDPTDVYVVIQNTVKKLATFNSNSTPEKEEFIAWLKGEDKKIVDEIKARYPQSGIKYMEI